MYKRDVTCSWHPLPSVTNCHNFSDPLPLEREVLYGRPLLRLRLRLRLCSVVHSQLLLLLSGIHFYRRFGYYQRATHLCSTNCLKLIFFTVVGLEAPLSSFFEALYKFSKWMNEWMSPGSDQSMDQSRDNMPSEWLPVCQMRQSFLK